jgi:hypothetical protein
MERSQILKKRDTKKWEGYTIMRCLMVKIIKIHNRQKTMGTMKA